MNMKNGRKPLSSKSQARPTPLNMDDVFGNPLGLDEDIIKEIQDKGLVYRFVSAPKLQAMGGYHQRGWKPYKRDSANMTSQTLNFGSDPEGYVRRGDLVLAVRSKELNEKHSAYLRQEAKRASGIAKAQAEELKDMVRGAQGMQVHEGYEDDGEDEDN